MKNSERIIDIKTEHGVELKTLFEILKDILPEVVLTFIKGNDAPKEDPKEVKADNSDSDSDSEEEQPKKRGRKPKNQQPKAQIKDDKKNKKNKKKSNDSDSDSDNDSVNSSDSDSSNSSDDEDDKKSKHKAKTSSEDPESASDDDSDNESSKKKQNDNESKSKDEDKKNETKGGIKILTLNDHKTLILYVRLFSDKFITFNVKADEHNIGVDLVQLHGFFKYIDKDGVLSMFINENDRQKIVIGVDSEKGGSTEYKLKLMDMNKKDYKIDAPQFDIMVTMETSEFHKVCREMNTVSLYMGITCSDNKVIFTAHGDSAELSKTYVNGKGVRIKASSGDDKKKKAEPRIVKEIYELKNLTIFGKCSALCQEVQILLKNKYPMFIKYTVASLGEMVIGLVPVNEDLLNKNTNYNEDDDKYYEDENKIKMKK